MTSDQVRIFVTNESSNVVAIQNNNTCKKKKKLCLTNELMAGIMEFKRMMVSKKHNKKIGIENLKLRGNDDDRDTKRMLRASISSLQEAIVRERTLRCEYVANVTKYADECRDLDRAKDDHIVSLQLMLADEDRVIAKLRADIEGEYEAYETLRRRFYSLYTDQRCGDGGGLARAVAGRLERCCDNAADNVSRHVDDGAAATTVRDIVASLRAGVRALAADAASAELGGRDAERYAADVVTRRLADACAANTGCGGNARMDSFAALCHAIDSMDERNRALADCANELDGQTESLQANLSEVATEYMTLSARKSAKKCKADVLDDFCAVTEQITVQQTRNLEFTRILAVDDKQIAEELNKIEQLKAKIARKNIKKQKLLKETDHIKGQLQVFKNQYEELKKRRAFLTEDLISVKRSPSKSELQEDVGQRAKHLKQLKLHFNTLTNKRDALKMKLQKQQQVAKALNRIN